VRPFSKIGGLLLCSILTSALLPAQGTKVSSTYRIGPKDLLEIEVLEDSSLGGQARVRENGTIDLPHVGAVPVAGSTAAQAARVIQEALERYLQRASVRVEVLEFRSRPISILGAVHRPGNLPFSGRWTLLEALTEAGGLTANRGDTIYVLRRAENGLSDQIAIDVEDLYLRADPTVNIPVFANDLINIPPAVDVTVFCTGEVRNSGAQVFKSTDEITLVTAIARAGGLNERASNKIMVKRRDQEFVLNYKRILEGTAPDFALEEGDVVIVKESFF
jgi:polysaccharide export outer membrane protein